MLMSILKKSSLLVFSSLDSLTPRCHQDDEVGVEMGIHVEGYGKKLEKKKKRNVVCVPGVLSKRGQIGEQ